ncbi:hypothetical protein NC653_026638 [Populus alba x Populus x berolinensis]|uniref:Uncharacterized protein n=1 Tax=Populus alba x Populus x berolinensis TaxID=444605 RepID=A0AAD6MEY3_9ROSI|nr:hypothetical protein NC653_026638 [Populus alba x Populus x berolinensis]
MQEKTIDVLSPQLPSSPPSLKSRERQDFASSKTQEKCAIYRTYAPSPFAGPVLNSGVGSVISWILGSSASTYIICNGGVARAESTVSKMALPSRTMDWELSAGSFEAATSHQSKALGPSLTTPGVALTISQTPTTLKTCDGNKMVSTG